MQFPTAGDLTAARNETLAFTRWAELRSVDSTAALSGNSLTRAVDANLCEFKASRTAIGGGDLAHEARVETCVQLRSVIFASARKCWLSLSGDRD